MATYDDIIVGDGSSGAVLAAIMPNIPNANTNLTCIMMGERAADWQRDQ